MSDIVVVTNGGYPRPEYLSDGSAGMTAAEATCRPGGDHHVLRPASTGMEDRISMISLE